MFTFFDFFSGIGGFRIGLVNNGLIPVGFCENNSQAVEVYRTAYDTEDEFFSNNIKNIKGVDLPYADVWTGGFPCQDISDLNKKGKGLEGERSGLYYEIIRLLHERKMGGRSNPTILFLENVSRLLRIHGGEDFFRILQSLDEQGYDVEWRLLNSVNFGLPQNRPRVYIIGYNREKCRPREILNTITPTYKNGEIVHSKFRYKSKYQVQTFIMQLTGITKCVMAGTAGKKMIETEKGVRFLTPLESLRVQGFPDWFYKRIKNSTPEHVIYRTVGNAVSPPVIQVIGAEIRKFLDENKEDINDVLQ